MPQVFRRSSNLVSRAVIFGTALLVIVLLYLLVEFNRSDYYTGVGIKVSQPIQFSHKHHVTDDGIDCRYCHESVETSSFAGIPSTKKCMNCHSQIWANSSATEPIRASWKSGAPIHWTRVNNLPDYVYFDHSIHIAKGVGCQTCHGRVDEMPVIMKTASMSMEWCLDCHKNPEKSLRPKQEIFNMAWQPPHNQEIAGKILAREYNIHSTNVLISCSTCHR
jgi:hypothetical protein